jgi:branched-chain amino acid transport system permease protein
MTNAPIVPIVPIIPVDGLDGLDGLANRKESATRQVDGFAVTVPVLVVVVLAVAGLVLLPLGRNHLSLGLGLGLGAAALVVAASGTLLERRSPLGRMLQLAIFGGALAFMVVFPLGRSNSTLIDLALFTVFAICVMGLNLTQGFAGQISLAAGAFLGLGAYSSSLFANGAHVAWGPLDATLPKVPYLATIPIAAFICLLFSVLIGFPALRVQGPWLAFVTVAFNGLVVLVMNNETELTGGPQGVNALRTNLRIFGVSMLDNRNFYYFCLGCMLAIAVLVWWIIRSPWGRAFRAVRDNPGRASSLGVSVPTYTLLAFAIGSMMSGVAGSLYAPLIEHIEPGGFSTLKSFSFLLGTVVGGVGTLVGPFIGTAFITFLENHLRFLGDNYQIAFAAFVIVLMLASPTGIVGASRRIRARVVARRKRRTT